MRLADYNFTVKYKEGKSMQLPDCLSRIPSTSDELYNWWHERNTPPSN